MRPIHWMSTPVVALAALTATPAVGADLPVKPAPAPVYAPPPFSWTGFYIGANIGGGWAHANIVDMTTGGGFGTGTPGAFVGGGQVGYNYQVGNVVFGVEGFIDGIASNNGNTSNVVVGAGGNAFQAGAHATWVSTLAARLGFTGPGFDHWLLYAKGGGAWVGYNATITDLTAGTSANTSDSRSGWMAGVGVEWAFAPNWTTKLEYEYIGLNGFSVGPTFGGNQFNVNNPNLQMVTISVNYLFH